MQVSDFAVGGGWWVQDHGWLADWLAGWLDAPARAHARMHPSSPAAHVLSIASILLVRKNSDREQQTAARAHA